MNITSLEVVSFRNIEREVIEPCDGVNIIYGDNAQGKTNLLESIWLFTGCRSFRGSKDNDLINFNSKKSLLSLDFFGYEREQNLYLEIEKGRKFMLNGVKMKSASKVMGEFLAVVFSPVHLSLVKDGPYERRRFLDIAISQLKPKYAVTLSQYNKALSERNVLLKDIYYHSELYDTLDIWEDRIAFYAGEIIRQRMGYINRLSQFCSEIYSGISCGKEKLKVSYFQQCPAYGENKQELYENIKILLAASRKNDIATGFTSVGPHRDDVEITIDGLSARSYGSQGQQRSAALALKLGEAAVIKDFSGQQPVALLDDVMSELDVSRQNYILNHIKDWQVFITCCDPASVQNLRYGKAFEMKKGHCIKATPHKK
ncbi:MAG: DNA replication/repair protein RecF [Faecalibacterium sp.]|nr:DNA replication/repair protein RecF [Ruminococcus sp.]MCM1392406.1 DNA replication/repair protein RecF [Ruminococcus sp.]MCM1486394.1 DNA replication/repair protein RecF [Faecalibacterium sp.]